jgi:hypothetical protein
MKALKADLPQRTRSYAEEIKNKKSGIRGREFFTLVASNITFMGTVVSPIF